MATFRVKYRLEYNSTTGLYRMPKAPELIKIAHAVATDVFFDSSSDYEPSWFDSSLLSNAYSGQIFFDVDANKNLIFTSSEITGDCLDKVYKFIDYTP